MSKKLQNSNASEGFIYRPDSRSGVSILHAFKALLKEIHVFRSHIATIFMGDFKASYNGTVLGVFWNIILPLIPITVYILLVNLKVFPRYDGLSPSVYIAYNVTLWMLLTGLITRPMQVVFAQNQNTMKTSMPMSVAIASSFAQLSFDTFVRLILVMGLIIAFSQWLNANIFVFLLSLISGAVFCLGVGLFLSILNMVYPDINRVVGIALQYGLFLSGVIFPVSTLGPLAVLELTNPFNVFIRASRDSLFFGGYEHLDALLIWGGVSLVFLFIALRFFYVMEHRIREMV